MTKNLRNLNTQFLFNLILSIFCCVFGQNAAFAANPTSYHLASDTTSVSRIKGFQSDSRFDVKVSTDLLGTQVLPYFGAHWLYIHGESEIFNDDKKGLHVGVDVAIANLFFLRGEFRNQQHETNLVSEQRSEGRYGLYFYHEGDFVKLLGASPRLLWSTYGESFFIPSLDTTRPTQAAWIRSTYQLPSENVTPALYLEAAVADRPTPDFGVSYQEVRPGVMLSKKLESLSLHLQLYKNILPATGESQDLQARFLLYGEWL